MSYTPTTWATGDTITATKLNKMEQGIAGAGGGKYDAYDYVIKQVDSDTPTFEKGSFSDVYDTLQDMEPVAGLFVKSLTPGAYYDTTSLFIPLTYAFYYSSTSKIYCKAVAIGTEGSPKHVDIELSSDGTISVTFLNI